ncbi:hypothetical protein HOB10_02000 [Candidatus Parcubacteria bacterium]|jgi:hypothetical protein|nr:hypothetical protein [Candidatus Parcubacteria bacterium]
MKKILFTLLLFSLALAGCTTQKQAPTMSANTNKESYNLGQDITTCLDITNAPQNIESVHFTLNLLGSDKSASQTTWTAYDTNIKDCYDLTKLEWSLSMSSLGTDHNKGFHSAITEGGQYTLETSLAIPTDNDNYNFVKAEPVKITLKKLIW